MVTFTDSSGKEIEGDKDKPLSEFIRESRREIKQDLKKEEQGKRPIPKTRKTRSSRFKQKSLKRFRKLGKRKFGRGTQKLLKTLSPQIKAAPRKRLKSRRPQMPGQSNSDPKAVYEKFKQQKQQMLISQALQSNQLSANTRAILERLARIQNLSRTRDLEQQRRLREKNVLAQAMDLTKVPYIFDKYQFDSTGVNSENILMAKNVFKETSDNPSIMKTERLNILETKKSGNDLKF